MGRLLTLVFGGAAGAAAWVFQLGAGAAGADGALGALATGCLAGAALYVG